MKITVVDTKGKATKKAFELNADMFEAKQHVDTLRQALHIHMANVRTGTAKAKNRGEVSGTGKKPWMNNKIGRARTGDQRTPIFTGGGVSHGPVPMNYSMKMPKKMKEVALYLALTDAANVQKIVVVEDFEVTGAQITKQLNTILDAIGGNVMYVASLGETLRRAAGNIRDFAIYDINHINAYDVVSAPTLVLMESAMEKLNGTKAVAATVTPKAASATTEKKPAAAKKTVAKPATKTVAKKTTTK
jgi:large subunit ribosomal protein L4